MPEFTWVATDLKTGVLLADLPFLELPAVKQTLGRYEQVSASLPIPTAPENWQRATLEGASVLNLLYQPTDTAGRNVGEKIPVWGAMVTLQKPNESDTVPLSGATVEAYLDRRFVGDENFVHVGQNIIVKTLVEKYAVAGPNGGVPFRVQFTTAGDGALRDLECKDKDDKTLYSILTDFMGIDGGPEWTVGWEWQHNPERITPVFYVGDRIGNAAAAGLGPTATFEMPGCVSSFEMVRDYSNGKGATSVVATSSGQGTLRPQSPAQTTSDMTRPTFEHRFAPSTSIKEVETLTTYAKGAQIALDRGTVSLSMSATTSAKGCPPLGLEWFIGDDLGFGIGGVAYSHRTFIAHDLFSDLFSDVFGATGRVLAEPDGYESVPAFPGGITGIARAVGWELDLTEPRTITPILLGAQIF